MVRRAMAEGSPSGGGFRLYRPWESAPFWGGMWIIPKTTIAKRTWFVNAHLFTRSIDKDTLLWFNNYIARGDYLWTRKLSSIFLMFPPISNGAVRSCFCLRFCLKIQILCQSETALPRSGRAVCAAIPLRRERPGVVP